MSNSQTHHQAAISHASSPLGAGWCGAMALTEAVLYCSRRPVTDDAGADDRSSDGHARGHQQSFQGTRQRPAIRPRLTPVHMCSRSSALHVSSVVKCVVLPTLSRTWTVALSSVSTQHVPCLMTVEGEKPYSHFFLYSLLLF